MKNNYNIVFDGNPFKENKTSTNCKNLVSLLYINRIPLYRYIDCYLLHRFHTINIYEYRELC